MDDTILNWRQKQILSLIENSSGLFRRDVRQRLPDKSRASIPTIARDLNFLLSRKFVRSEGRGPATKYFSRESNPLLRFIDIDSYFEIEPDRRVGAKKAFNLDIFDNLLSLYAKEEIKEIDKISESFSQKAKILGRDIFLRELERFTIELSWKSSRIEGNTYSLLDTEALIKQKIEAAGHTREEAIMILNHKNAFSGIMNHPKVYKKISFSAILQLHNIIVKDLNVDTGLRKRAVGITGTLYKPLDNEWQIREAMEKLISIVNKIKYPLGKALVILSMISYIQPFSDGNKRTARILANASLIANDFYPLSFRSVDESFYKKALIVFYEQNSLFYLKRMITDQYRFAISTYFR